jgi:hypothetical protein
VDQTAWKAKELHQMAQLPSFEIWELFREFIKFSFESFVLLPKHFHESPKDPSYF